MHRLVSLLLAFSLATSSVHAQNAGATVSGGGGGGSRHEGHEEIELTLTSSQNEGAPGSPIYFFLAIENTGTVSKPVTVTVTADRALELLQVAGGAVFQDGRLTWNNLPVAPHNTITLVLVGALGISAKPQERAGLQAEAEGKSLRAEILVQGTPYVTSLGDPVLYWNTVALDANAADHSGTFGSPEQPGPNASARALAIVHAAIYDAVNSIDRGHSPYIAFVPYRASFVRVSVDSAVASAGRTTLSSLYPKQRAEFDSAYNRHLSEVPDSTGKRFGVSLGQAAAFLILDARRNDGSSSGFSHTPSPLPGKHRVDPLNPGQPYLDPKWGTVRPFAMGNTQQFMAPPVPAMTSVQYSEAFDEVKRLGSDGVITPTERTQEQTEIGLFWAYDGTNKMGTPPRLYNQIAQVIAKERGNTVVENARLFALINIAQADAGIAAWAAKYRDDFWRPIVAIREADAGTGPTGQGDGNPATIGDANWTPLGAPNSNQSNANNFTPPFPAYPSGHATFGAAAFHAIALFYGTDNIPFTFMSEEMNGHTTDNKGRIRPARPRSFTRLSDAALENALSRIYLGIHWRFDATAGIASGNAIADHTFTTILQSR